MNKKIITLNYSLGIALIILGIIGLYDYFVIDLNYLICAKRNSHLNYLVYNPSRHIEVIIPLFSILLGNILLSKSSIFIKILLAFIFAIFGYSIFDGIRNIIFIFTLNEDIYYVISQLLIYLGLLLIGLVICYKDNWIKWEKYLTSKRIILFILLGLLVQIIQEVSLTIICK